MLLSQLWLEDEYTQIYVYYNRKIQVIIVYNLVIKVEININKKAEMFTDKNS